jgi:hypothetical protein
MAKTLALETRKLHTLANLFNEYCITKSIVGFGSMTSVKSPLLIVFLACVALTPKIPSIFLTNLCSF